MGEFEEIVGGVSLDEAAVLREEIERMNLAHVKTTKFLAALVEEAGGELRVKAGTYETQVSLSSLVFDWHPETREISLRVEAPG